MSLSSPDIPTPEPERPPKIEIYNLGPSPAFNLTTGWPESNNSQQVIDIYNDLAQLGAVVEIDNGGMNIVGVAPSKRVIDKLVKLRTDLGSRLVIGELFPGDESHVRISGFNTCITSSAVVSAARGLHLVDSPQEIGVYTIAPQDELETVTELGAVPIGDSKHKQFTVLEYPDISYLTYYTGPALPRPISPIIDPDKLYQIAFQHVWVLKVDVDYSSRRLMAAIRADKAFWNHPYLQKMYPEYVSRRDRELKTLFDNFFVKLESSLRRSLKEEIDNNNILIGSTTGESMIIYYTDHWYKLRLQYEVNAVKLGNEHFQIKSVPSDGAPNVNLYIYGEGEGDKRVLLSSNPISEDIWREKEADYKAS